MTDEKYSHAVWTDANPEADSDIIKIKFCAHMTKHDTHPGYMRFEHSKAPDPAHTTTLHIEDTPTANIHALTWDEESGHICMLSFDAESEEKYLIAVDLI